MDIGLKGSLRHIISWPEDVPLGGFPNTSNGITQLLGIFAARYSSVRWTTAILGVHRARVVTPTWSSALQARITVAFASLLEDVVSVRHHAMDELSFSK